MALKLTDRELLFLSELAKGCTLTASMLRASMDNYMVANLVTRMDMESDDRKKARDAIKKNEEEIAKLKKNTITPRVSKKTTAKKSG